MPERLAPLFTWRTAILDSDLPPITRLVLLTLSTYMNEQGESAFPSYRTLARKTGLGRSTVIRHVTAAIEAGWLKKTPQTRQNGSTRSNLYVPGVP